MEIPISIVMPITYFAKRYPPERVFSGTFAEAMEKATYCNECSECEPRCPYYLPIREMIAEKVDWYQEAKRKYWEQVDTKPT